MAGEIFIARQDTLEDVQGTVNTIDTNVDAVKLSTETIDQIADTILERIGLTTDSGGGTTAGSIFAKLNALLSAGSGGITGFKYIYKTANFSYTTQASGILLGRGYDDYFILTNAYIIQTFQATEGSDTKPRLFGAFAKNALIRSTSNDCEVYIFEFI